MKKIIAVIIFGITILTTSSCTWVNKQTKKNPPSNKNMICAQLKRQMLFNENYPSTERSGSDYNRRNQLLSQYKKFGCE